MDGAEVLRAARRRQGWSQRELAARSGVALSTISAVEAERRQASLPVLVAVLREAGLELTVDLPPPPVEPEVVRHLRRSTSARLHLALGGDGRPDGPGAHPDAWRQLARVAGAARVHLHDELARSVWLPTSAATVLVCADGWLRGVPPAWVSSQAPSVSLLPPCQAHVASPARVRLGPHQVLLDPPADLALQPEQAEHRGALRSVARLLHEGSPRDAVGRRPRAHRDPDHTAEHAHVFHTKQFSRLRLPEWGDVRSWRLDDSASKAEWLRRQGYPT